MHYVNSLLLNTSYSPQLHLRKCVDSKVAYVLS